MATSDFDIETIIEQTPLFNTQWYLQNTGQAGGTPGADANVVDAWSTATGKGVVIGIVDSGIFEHPDLDGNYASDLGYDFVEQDNNPLLGLLNQTEKHGTQVAGVAVGDGDNEIGIIGVAPDAKFASLRTLVNAGSVDDFLSDSSTSDRLQALFWKNQDIDIYNNSWNFSENTVKLPAEITDGIKNSIEEGRGGLGNIYVFAAGNEGLEDNVNYDPLTNSRHSIAVAAIDHNGEHSSYSTPGASLLISGYGGEIDPNAEPHSSTTIYDDWTFTSARHWGESSEGEWTLTVLDANENSIDGTWNSWDINLYGTANEDTSQTIDLFRFRNTTFDTGCYVFVGEQEKNDIIGDPNLSKTFSLDGEREDGTVNPAFTASTTPGDDLIPFYRLKNLDVAGTFLFVGEEEYNAIFAEDSEQKDNWEREGLDTDGEDIPEFYLYDRSADRGTEFNRFQNTENGTFLYASPEETAAIENDPDLSDLFVNQGVAFESLA